MPALGEWVSRRGPQGAFGLFLAAVGILVLLFTFLPAGFVRIVGAIALGLGVALVVVEIQFKNNHQEKPLAVLVAEPPLPKDVPAKDISALATGPEPVAAVAIEAKKAAKAVSRTGRRVAKGFSKEARQVSDVVSRKIKDKTDKQVKQ